MEGAEFVVSRDGTKIGYWRSGSGRPLVLVHGSPADRSSFALLAPHLESSITVCALDRRGRGLSDDGPAYAHEREFEDVASVVDSLGPDASLFGHSYGGVCALEAARLAKNLRRLVLYEPWIGRYPEGTVEKIEHQAAAGDDEELLLTIFRDVGQFSEEDIEAIRARPNWKARAALAPVTVREVRAEDAYTFDPARFAGMRVTTLLLAGEKSPPAMRATIETICAALPDCRIEELPGQEHVAQMNAPDMLADRILAFLS